MDQNLGYHSPPRGILCLVALVERLICHLDETLSRHTHKSRTNICRGAKWTISCGMPQNPSLLLSSDVGIHTALDNAKNLKEPGAVTIRKNRH